MKIINYQILFDSDWAVHDGRTFADIDSCLLRDTNGFPYIPGRTIKGVLRESFEEIEDSLINIYGNKIDATSYFGANIFKKNYNDESLFIFSNLELSSNLRDQVLKLNISERDVVLKNISITVPRISIDKETKMSKEKSLAKIELGRKGMTFYGDIRKINSETFKKEEYELFELLFKYTRRLGALRTRGKGKCKIELVKGAIL